LRLLTAASKGEVGSGMDGGREGGKGGREGGGGVK
jgi:hypothetical protein